MWNEQSVIFPVAVRWRTGSQPAQPEGFSPVTENGKLHQRACASILKKQSYCRDTIHCFIDEHGGSQQFRLLYNCLIMAGKM